jgi:hypothetical protein
MSVRTSMNFIQWLMRKWFGGTGRSLVNLNRWWTLKVQDEPGEAFALMILFGCMILLVALLLAAFILYYFGVDLFAFFTIGSQVIWVGNYLRIIIVDQYNQFKEEQNRMFDEIKYSDRGYRRMR